MPVGQDISLFAPSFHENHANLIWVVFFIIFGKWDNLIEKIECKITHFGPGPDIPLGQSDGGHFDDYFHVFLNSDLFLS